MSSSPQLSIILPAYQEGATIVQTLLDLQTVLQISGLSYELLVIFEPNSEESSPETHALLSALPHVQLIENPGPKGYGAAVQVGLRLAQGTWVAIMMADGSEDPQDLLAMMAQAQPGVAAVFGSRFCQPGLTVDYPPLKWVFNRLGNKLIQLVFNLPYDDVTNGFKLYRRQTVEDVMPLEAAQFDLAIELPLKVIRSGASFRVVPTHWKQRREGTSKFNTQALLGPYLCWVWRCFWQFPPTPKKP